MNNGRIRAARPGDVAAIARIHVETWRATYAGTLPDAYLVRMDRAYQQRAWRQMVADSSRSHRVLVAVLSDGEVVGFASCGRARRSMLPRHAPYDGEVYTLYVALDHQGHGHGKRLLSACFDVLRNQGRTAAVVWVLAANPARFFYEAQGGRRIAERSESFAGTELEELAFGWELAPRPASR